MPDNTRYCLSYHRTPTTDSCTLSLHDALPISLKRELVEGLDIMIVRELTGGVYFGEPKEITTLDDGSKRAVDTQVDRKSTRLNSSHVRISYAVFCLKKQELTIQPKLPPHARNG